MDTNAAKQSLKENVPIKEASPLNKNLRDADAAEFFLLLRGGADEHDGHVLVG
jgi:hypothetical protein